MSSFFKKSYSATVIIARDHESVWQLLADLNTYADWNPFTPQVKAAWEIGSKVILTVRMVPGRKPIKQTEYLSRFEPPNLLAWGMRWGVFLKAERIQQLTLTADHQTQYFTEDIIEGLLAPLVHWLYGKHIQKGFEETAQSLKVHLESKNK